MAGVVMLIWGNHEAIYFFARDWTGSITLKGLKKSACTRISGIVAQTLCRVRYL
jgi:hypothetical protein